MIYPSDRHGFNNPDREWDSSQVDLALTGDSFSHGFSVPPGEDIAGQIRLITGKNVLTLGMAGNGPLAELAALKEYAESKKPKTVLWLFHESTDMADLARESSIPLLRSYLQPNFSQNLIHRQQEIDNRILEFIGRQTFLSTTRILRLTSLRKKLHELFSRGRRMPVNLGADIDPLFSKILTKARDRTAAWGGKLHFIYLPGWARYAKDVQKNDLEIKRSEVVRLVKDLNIPVIDIHQEVFANDPDPLSFFQFRAHTHYTSKGYSAVAKAIVLAVMNDQSPQGL